MYRTVIVGSNGEIGRALCEAALRRGDLVAALDLSAWPMDGCRMSAEIDTRSIASVRAALSAAAQELGGLDVLVNAAGIMAKGPLSETRDADFAEVINVNLGGAFRLTQAASDLMDPGSGGSIVHMSSIHALRGAAMRVSYAASKGGITALVQAAACELGPRGITVNAVAPGPTGRGMGSSALERIRALQRIPLRRAATPEEVAAAAMFLTSPAGRGITGHVLPVDGGATATFFAAALQAEPADADGKHTTLPFPVSQGGNGYD